MNDTSKLDRKLRVLVERVAQIDPSFEVDLVVDPEEASTKEPIVESIIAAGGKLEDRPDDRLQFTLPIGKVSALATKAGIANIRLTRQHRMHSKKSW